MNSMSGIRVFAPASIGNVSVGFDALGLAIAPLDGTLLGDVVALQAADLADWTLSTAGDYAHELPDDPERNVVLAACRRFAAEMAERERAVRPLAVTLEKRLPVGTGLGSSSASVVAAFEALNRFHGEPLDPPALFGLMADMEGSVSGGVHTDNIGPACYGGLRLCPPGSNTVYRLPWPEKWQVVVCWPGTRLETRASRALLPESVPLRTAIEQSTAFASFVHALYSGDAELAAASMVDLIVEPHRRALLPGFDAACEELPDLGVLAVGISGSGPSVFAVVDNPDSAGEAAAWLDSHYRTEPHGFVHICRAEMDGARTVT